MMILRLYSQWLVYVFLFPIIYSYWFPGNKITLGFKRWIDWKQYVSTISRSEMKIDIKSSTSPLMTSPLDAKLEINSLRWILPGDYVVHTELGIGQYLGIRVINLTPFRSNPFLEPVAIVKFADAEVSWLKRFVRSELWLYRSGDVAYPSTSKSSITLPNDINSILDLKKWNKKKFRAQEESMAIALNLIRLAALRNSHHRIPYVPNDERFHRFEQQFVYTPTIDQELAFTAIESDMVNSSRPMDRLICGDVGFGKTEVAMRAVYRCVLSNKQVALLAPTRILALQHLRTLRNRMPDVNIQLLRGASDQKESKKIKQDILSGTCQVIVGTHAILQPSVQYRQLGLVIIDEEQRFGVCQKENLRNRTSGIDVLTLSATPIPRTLQLSMSGQRDISVMTSPPIGRKDVTVHVGKVDDMIIQHAIKREIDRDGQLFVVVPFIRDIDDVHQRLLNIVDKMSISATIIEAHGQHVDLEDRIEVFQSRVNNARILISTTVIENGIDMPSVNTILVFNANRFGMSALYQLKGRVGRSTRQAYSYFFTPHNEKITIEAEERLTCLKVFTALGSGYELARRDMNIRGHGTIFGSEQSGSSDIGVDMTSSIIQSAMEQLKREFILSVPETRVDISCGSLYHMESTFSSPLPSLVHVNESYQVARWEHDFTKHILSISFSSNNNDHSNMIDVLLEDILQCQTVDDFVALEQVWESKYSHQVSKSTITMLQELVNRWKVRRVCQQIGIFNCRYDAHHNHVVFMTNEIDSSKWKNLTSKIPQNFDKRVEFVDGMDNDGTIRRPSCITLQNVYGDTLSIMREIVELLHPLGLEAQKAFEVQASNIYVELHKS